MLGKLMRAGEGRIVKQLRRVYEYVDTFSNAAAALTDTELAAKTREFRSRHKAGESLDDLLGEAFAVAREAAARSLGQRPNYTQIMAAAALHHGLLVELGPGEGKTLACALAAYLNAIPGDGVHVVTATEYLAQRDARSMGRLYEFLGLATAVIAPRMGIRDRHDAYRADITYATKNGFGYDYVRDNLATAPQMLVQRELNVAIVDDADQVLADQAGVALFITGPTEIADAVVSTADALRANVRLSTYRDRSMRRRVDQDRDQDRDQDENQVLATVPVAGFFRQYRKLAAITGVAGRAGAEIHQVYQLEGVSIPSAWATTRTDHPDLVYKSAAAKYAAIIDDVVEHYQLGQPVLLATAVDNAEMLERELDQRGVPYQVADGRDPWLAAEVITQAARPAAVTLAAGITGWGVDAVLGGNAEGLTDRELRSRQLDPANHPEDYRSAHVEVLAAMTERVAADGEVARGLGGLYVIATERYPAHRIDAQLRGRTGRRGEPGETRFYLSLEDDLVQRHNGEAAASVSTSPNLPDEVPVESKAVTQVIDVAQLRAEVPPAEARIASLNWDEVTGKQRTVVYARRRKVLDEPDLGSLARRLVAEVITAYVTEVRDRGDGLDDLWAELKTLYPVGVSSAELANAGSADSGGLTYEAMVAGLIDDALRAYDAREAQVQAVAGPGAMRQVERAVLLSMIDRRWREYLYQLDHLRKNVGWRSTIKKQPLQEYQHDSHAMFTAMLATLDRESVRCLFNVEVTAMAPAEPEPSKPAPPA